MLAEVDGALAAQLPGAFSPGVPPAFHANYLAAQVGVKSGLGRVRRGHAEMCGLPACMRSMPTGVCWEGA